MAHHKSAIKRIQIGERNRLRNRYYLSTMKTYIKKVLLSENKEQAEANFKKAVSILDKLVVKGIIHRNTAANKKSKLAKFVKSL
ncbi:MAG: 30S ribosomal protein S20 [Calditrichia bacterium]